MKTKQEELWGGEFGNKYHARNPQADHSALWNEVIGSRLAGVHSVFEPGAGMGDNLVAIRDRSDSLGYGCRVTGMDVNAHACAEMDKRGIVAIHGAFPNTPIDNRYDLIITRGFLIHLPNYVLKPALEKIYQMANRYICFAEYYSPRRRTVSYHGEKSALWTGDYAGMLMDMHPDVELIKYGFKYGRVCGYDLTHFLMEKKQC